MHPIPATNAPPPPIPNSCLNDVTSVCLVHLVMLYERGRATGAVLWNAQCVHFGLIIRSFFREATSPHERPSQRDRDRATTMTTEHRFTEVRAVVVTYKKQTSQFSTLIIKRGPNSRPRP